MKSGGRTFKVTGEDHYNFKLNTGYLEFRHAVGGSAKTSGAK